MTLPWWYGAVFYQVYVRSFADSDGDGIGDLPGLISHLDHLSELGIDAICLSNSQPSNLIGDGYNVTDFCLVNPDFGTVSDIASLITAVHQRGLRLVMDFSPTHTSDRHPWFLQSRSGQVNPYRSWFLWRNSGRDGGPPNNWRTEKTDEPAWSYDAETGQWYANLYSPTQPDLDWRDPAVSQAVCDALSFWLDRGVDGFRIGSVHCLGKDPSLSNSPDRRGRRRDRNWPVVHDYLADLRRTVDAYPDRVLIGAVLTDEARRLSPYFNAKDGLHIVQDMGLAGLDWDANIQQRRLSALLGKSGRGALPALAFGDADTPRLTDRHAVDGSADAIAAASATLLLTLPGVPFLYQGDELGLYNSRSTSQELAGDRRGSARAPIPWERPSSTGDGCGFTKGEPWITIADDAEQRCVQARREEPKSVFYQYRSLLDLRRESHIFRYGDLRWLIAPDGALAYVRRVAQERILIAINTTGEPVRLGRRLSRFIKKGELLASTQAGHVLGTGQLAEYEAIVMRLEDVQ